MEIEIKLWYTKGIAKHFALNGRREVRYMPSNEKELNCYLFDQLAILEDLEEIAEKEKAEETLKAIAKKRKQIERKLYQKPPLVNE